MLLEGGGTREKTQIIYVASATTSATEEYRAFIQAFKQELRGKTDALILEWLDKAEPPLEEFFKRDLKNVNMCHVMIAFVDRPSVGVGLEIAEALKQGKPLLCLAEEGAKVSRLLMAASENYVFPVETYKDLSGAATVATKFIAERKPVDIA
jgi:nucleoside 2-deoxyribosyltransferase